MCLIVKGAKRNSEPVTCFKVTTLDENGNRKALYQSYSYPKELEGVLIVDNAPIVSTNYHTRESGYLHAFENYRDAVFVINILGKFYKENNKCLYEIWKCEIPENELYFIGYDHDVCSRQLKFINRITVM